MSFQVNELIFLQGAAAARAAPAFLPSSQQARAAPTAAPPGSGIAHVCKTLAADECATLTKEKTEDRVQINVVGAETLRTDAATTGALDPKAKSQGAISAIVAELKVSGLPFLFGNSEEVMALPSVH